MQNKYNRKAEWQEGPEWVIYSRSKNANWGGGERLSFLTFQDAKIEYDKQMAMLPSEIRDNVDWKIEERHWGVEIYTDSIDKTRQAITKAEPFGAFE